MGIFWKVFISWPELFSSEIDAVVYDALEVIWVKLSVITFDILIWV